MLSAAFEKTAFRRRTSQMPFAQALAGPAPVLSRRAEHAKTRGKQASPRIPRVGWDDDFMNLPPICLSDSGQNNAKIAWGYAS
jgi:hypothetical protein